eukprot:TRINITY_DN1792_c1_g1_i1.p1 TRINITY_DN1792_c1_g1~~TRINITY_DN1792_c1_g1_i1.p1  ORF type:complete len:624 (+),score=116.67 TRINITY_DN1792_c1_g1_i1:64-1872(+)
MGKDKRRRRSPSASSSSSSSRSAVKRRKDKKDKKLKKEKKEAEKREKKQREYCERVAKGLNKIIENNEDLDKGRPLSLVKAGFTGVLSIVLAILDDVSNGKNDLKNKIIPQDDSRLHFVKSVNYGLELLLRIGFDNPEESGIYALKDKYLPLLEDAKNILLRGLVHVTSLIPDTLTRLTEECLGLGGLQNITGDVDIKNETTKSVGVITAALSGDILGLPLQSWTRASIKKWFDRVAEFQSISNIPLGRYSGDTAIQLYSAMSIIEQGKIDCKKIASKITQQAAQDADRSGYTSEVFTLITSHLRKGAEPRRTGTSINPQGLSGKESCSLVPLMALYLFNHKTGAIPDDAVVLDSLKAILLPFIIHPDGIGVAFVYCQAVMYLLKIIDTSEFNPIELLEFLIKKCELLNMSINLQKSLKNLQKSITDGVADEGYLTEGIVDEVDDDSDEIFTSGVGCLCGSLWVFITMWKTPIIAVSDAVGLGEASNTTGMVVGSLCGALHGASWIPYSWFDLIENGDGFTTKGIGRDRALQIAIDISSLSPTVIKNLEDPLPYQQPTYSALSKPADEPATTESSIPAAPAGTNSLVAAMPISLRKYAPLKE